MKSSPFIEVYSEEMLEDRRMEHVRVSSYDDRIKTMYLSYDDHVNKKLYMAGWQGSTSGEGISEKKTARLICRFIKELGMDKGNIIKEMSR